MEIATLTSKGQVTLPAALRRQFGLSTGDRLLFYESEGRCILAPLTPENLRYAEEAARRAHPNDVEEIARLCAPVAREYGVKRLTLFGSCARGEAGWDSDVDLFVESDSRLSLARLGGLLEALKAVLGRDVDLLSEGTLTEELRAAIQKDGRIVYEQPGA